MNQNVNINLLRFQKNLYQEYVTQAIAATEKPATPNDFATTPVLEKIRLLLPAFLRKLPLAYLPSQSAEIISILAKESGLSEQQIFLTAGAEDALRAVSQVVLSSDTQVYVPTPTFPRIQLYPQLVGASLRQKPLDFNSASMWKKSLFQSINKSTEDVIYLTNPNNPTGYTIPLEELLEFCSKHEDKFFVIDASLNNFFEEGKELSLLSSVQNVGMIFSFSKSFGIPGLRLGFVVSANSQLITALKQTQSPLQISSASLAVLGALLKKKNTLHQVVAEYRKNIQENFLLLQQSLPTSCRIIGESNYNCVVVSKKKKNLSAYLAKHGFSFVELQSFPGFERFNGIRVILNQDNFDGFCSILQKY